jgi:uncharacterized RDD family membrane protein YckC
MDYAPFWKRVVSYFIDGALLGIVSGIGSVVVGIIMAVDPTGVLAVLALFGYYGLMFIVSISYYAVMDSSPLQGTVGKLVLGMKVTDLEGRRIGLLTSVVRTLIKLFSGVFLLLPWLAAAFTEKKQAVHDMVAKTVVINK